MNWTHLLEFEVASEIKLVFIQNLFTEKKKRKGHNYVSSSFISDYARSETKIDGYAGCNECEIMLVKESLKKLNPVPTKIETRPMLIDDGRRTRKTRKRKNRKL